MRKKEYLLSLDEKIWIGDLAQPIPPGTYDRWYEILGPRRLISFRGLDLKEATFDPSTWPLYREHRPSRINPDRIVLATKQTFSPLAHRLRLPVEHTDRVLPEIYPKKQKLPRASVVGPAQLKQSGLTQLEVVNANWQTIWGIDSIKCIISSQDRITIFWVDDDNFLHRSTYNRIKISPNPKLFNIIE